MPAKKGATTKKTVQKPLEEAVTGNYTVQLYVSGIKYTVEAPTLEEALYMLRPSFLRGRVVITVTHGDKKKRAYSTAFYSEPAFQYSWDS